MKDNYSHISIVLDRSGSMGSVQDATIEGLNGFIKQQQSLKDVEATVTLVQFDDKYEVNYDFRPLKDVVPLNKATYQPRGSTALLDAIAKTIDATGKALAALPESLRPSKVIFVIQTDGYENASREFTRNQVFDLISHQRDKYLWEFLFLGAGQDAIATAALYGIASKSSLSYTANNTSKVFASAADYTSGALKSRCASDMSSLTFSEADRAAAVAPDNSSVTVTKTTNVKK
jgi:uncharacterized protein YegL